MTFSFTNYAALKPQRSPLHDALGRLLSGYGETTKSRYLPESIQATNFNKMIGPLATLAASPLMTALHPEQQEQINSVISQALKQYGNGRGGIGQGGQGVPQGQGGGVLDKISSLFGMGGNKGEQQGAMTPGHMTSQGYEGSLNGQPGTPSGYSNNGAVPQDQVDSIISQRQQQANQQNNPALALPSDVRGGATQQIEQGFTTSKVPPGSVVTKKSGEVISAAGPEAIARSQRMISAVNSVEPLLKDIAKEARPFLKAGGTLHRIGGEIAGAASKLGVPEELTKMLGDPQKASDWKQFNTDIDTATEKLIGALNLPSSDQTVHMVRGILTPNYGEVEKGYTARVVRQLSQLQHTADLATQTLGSGYQLNGHQVAPPGASSPNPSQVNPQMSVNVRGENGFQPNNVDEKIAQDDQQRSQIEDEASFFKTSPEIIMEALSKGIKTEQALRKFIKSKSGAR